jgi:uncharacterized membrane protein YccC
LLFAFLAAVYLTIQTGNQELREDFRRRARLGRQYSHGGTKSLSFLKSPVLQSSIRTAIAVIASLVVARIARLPEAYWAPIATLIVLQSNAEAAWGVARHVVCISSEFGNWPRNQVIANKSALPPGLRLRAINAHG